MVIKGKTEEILIKQLKTCEKKMQEITDSIKRPNLRIMGIEEGEEVQAKGMRNIVNKIITETFPNLEKDIRIQMQEAPGQETDHIKIELPHDISSLKQQVQKLGKEY
jgi:type II secretory pathway component GspD/PulD (secretin)